MDIIGTIELIAKAVSEPRIEYKNIAYKILTKDLFLVLGEDNLRENGFGDYIPKRMKWKKSKENP